MDNTQRLSGKKGAILRKISGLKKENKPVPDEVYTQLATAEYLLEEARKATKASATKASAAKASKGLEAGKASKGLEAGKASKGLEAGKASKGLKAGKASKSSKGAKTSMSSEAYKASAAMSPFGLGSEDESAGEESIFGKEGVKSEDELDEFASIIQTPPSLQKRNASPSSTNAGSVRGNPKKRRIEQSELGGLRFDPSEKPLSFVPVTLKAHLPAGKTHQLPLVVQLGGKALTLTLDRDPAEETRSFWLELRKRAKALEPTLKEHHFQPLTASDVNQLKFGSALLPRLLGQDGRLLYEDLTKKDTITKAQYKTYLRIMKDNLQALIDNQIHDLKEASVKEPLSKQGVALKILGGNKSKQTISIHEHSKVLESQTQFLYSTLEIIRKDLACQGVLLSNLAEVTKQQRLEISAIAEFAQGLIQLRSDPNTSDLPDPTAADMPNPTISDLADPTLLEPSDSADPSPTVNPTLLTVNPASTPYPTLPDIILQSIGAHKCQCDECDPGFIKECFGEADKRYHESLNAKAEVQAYNELIEEHTARLDEEVNDEVRATLKEELREEVIREYRTELEEQIGKEWKATETTRIKEELRKEMRERLQGIAGLV